MSSQTSSSSSRTSRQSEGSLHLQELPMKTPTIKTNTATLSDFRETSPCCPQHHHGDHDKLRLERQIRTSQHCHIGHCRRGGRQQLADVSQILDCVIVIRFCCCIPPLGHFPTTLPSSPCPRGSLLASFHLSECVCCGLKR